VVQCLPSKCKALSSNSNTTTTKKKKNPEEFSRLDVAKERIHRLKDRPIESIENKIQRVKKVDPPLNPRYMEQNED
jgi:hypothetical protein